jgi:hypothetical protein
LNPPVAVKVPPFFVVSIGTSLPYGKIINLYGHWLIFVLISDLTWQKAIIQNASKVPLCKMPNWE